MMGVVPAPCVLWHERHLWRTLRWRSCGLWQEKARAERAVRV